MTDHEFKFAYPANTVTVLSGDVSIGDTLRKLKNEQQFLGKKLYTQLAATLVSIPCSPDEQSREQKDALARIVSFADIAKDFRESLARDRYGVDPSMLDIKRNLTINALRQNILATNAAVKKVDYMLETTTQLASDLSKLYLDQLTDFLARLRPKLYEL